MPFPPLVSLIVTLPLAATDPVVAAPPVHHRFYFKDAVPLRLDASRLAVRRADGAGDDAVAGRLGAFGVAADDVTRWPVARWSVADVPPALRSDAAVRVVAEALPAAAEIEFVSPVFLDEEERPIIVTPDLLVGFAPGVSAAEAEEILRRIPALLLERDFGGMPGVYRLRSDHRNGLDVLADANALAVDPEVRFAEPDFILTGHLASTIVDDPDFYRCWGVHNTGQSIAASTPGGVFDFDMDGPEAWAITRGHPSVIAVVFDNGIELDHPDLSGGGGRDFANPLQSQDSVPGAPRAECDNHGTAVAGTIAGRADNGLGVVGIAPECTVAAARVFNMLVPEGECTNMIVLQSSWIVQGLEWAYDSGARVTNHSYSIGSSGAITAKFAQTYEQGMVHFAAAGNQGNQGLGYPGILFVVNSIAAGDHLLGGLASFSNYGPGMAFVAPGHRIATVDRSGGFGYAPGPGPEDNWVIVSGTSVASPYAAGVAALVLSADPTLTPPEVELIMKQSATDLITPGYDDLTGWGLLNARAALELATGTVRGDVNTDGRIDVNDLISILVHWGTCADPTLTCHGDATADSTVNELDLLTVLDNWQ